ncbi:Uncharacterised protein [Mycobacteroides abscessus subsp. abscessus]|nr:Uncharacterised protein [Mycobacteroides abscessus subsp. abscessus]
MQGRHDLAGALDLGLLIDGEVGQSDHHLPSVASRRICFRVCMTSLPP